MISRSFFVCLLEAGQADLSLVELRQLLEPFPLLGVMAEDHQPDLLPLDQVKELVRARANGRGVRVAPAALLYLIVLHIRQWLQVKKWLRFLCYRIVMWILKDLK